MRRNDAGSTAERELRELVERVARLERQNRMWKLGGILAAVVLALAVAVGARAQHKRDDLLRPRTIVAEDFMLKDAAGVTRGELTMKNGVPVLQLYDVDGRVFWSTAPRVLIGDR